MNRNQLRLTRLAVLAGGLSLYVLGAGLLGCSGGNGDNEEVVAEVGARPIELRRITDYLTALHVDYPTAERELEARERQLELLIKNELLIIGAYSQAFDADIGIIELVDREKDKFLLDELFRREIMDKATVTEDEIKEVYSHAFDRVELRHILVETKAKADSVFAQVQAGGDFGDLAEAHSRDQRTSIRGGDFGREFSWGELIPPLQDLAFSLKEGEIGGPVESEFGWHIVKIKSRSRVEEKPIEELWTPIESNLKRLAMEELRLGQLENLRAEAKITLVPEGLAALRQQVRLVSDTASGVLRARRNIPVDSLPGAIKDLHVATFGRDGIATVGQMAELINARPFEGRADMADDERVQEIVFQIGLFDLLRDQALRLRMDEEPLYQERLVEFREKLMAEKMRNAIIARNLRLPEEDIRNYYEAYPDSFIEPTAYHVREVMVHDSMLAREILNKARRGTPLANLASQYTERTGFKTSGGDLGWVNPDRYPDLYEPASKLKRGEVGGPYAGIDQYSIIEVIDMQPPRMRNYDEVQASLFKRLQERRTDSIMTAYVDSMKVIHPVIIREDVLRRNLRVMASKTEPTQKSG